MNTPIKQIKLEKKLQILYRISKEINSTLSIDAVLNKALDLSIELTQVERWIIFLFEKGMINIKTARDMDEQTIKDAKEYSKTVIKCSKSG